MVATPFDTTVKTSHLFLSSNFQDCHTAPGIQKCEKNSRSTYQLFTKETCEAELRGPVFGNVVGAWCKPLHTAQKTCKVCCWFLKSFQFQSEPLPLICKFTSDCAAQCPLLREEAGLQQGEALAVIHTQGLPMESKSQQLCGPRGQSGLLRRPWNRRADGGGLGDL